MKKNEFSPFFKHVERKSNAELRRIVEGYASTKPETRNRKRRVRQTAFTTTLDGAYKLTIYRDGCSTVYSFVKFTPQLQG